MFIVVDKRESKKINKVALMDILMPAKTLLTLKMHNMQQTPALGMTGTKRKLAGKGQR
jgi:hypothetical protein